MFVIAICGAEFLGDANDHYRSGGAFGHIDEDLVELAGDFEWGRGGGEGGEGGVEGEGENEGAKEGAGVGGAHGLTVGWK